MIDEDSQDEPVFTSHIPNDEELKELYENLYPDNNTKDESKTENKKITVKSPWELFGIDVGYGWYGLVLPIIKEINRYNEENPDDELIISQVKEKWGQLVIYTAWSSDDTEYIEKMIERAEHESQYICEVCGARGQLREVNGWYMTLCKRHREAAEYKDIIFKLTLMKNENKYMAKNKINGKWYIVKMERERDKTNFYLKFGKKERLLDIHIKYINENNGNGKWYIIENNKAASKGENDDKTESLEKAAVTRIFSNIRDGMYNAELSMFCLEFRTFFYEEGKDCIQMLNKLDEYTIKKRGNRRWRREKYEYIDSNENKGFLIQEKEIYEGENRVLTHWYFKEDFDKESAEKYLKENIKG